MRFIITGLWIDYVSDRMSSKTEMLLAEAAQAHAAGRLRQAEDLARQALAGDPSSVGANLLLGVIAGKTGRTDSAFHHLQAVIDAQPDSLEALFWLSTLHRRNGNLPEALRFAEEAARVRPRDAFVQNNLGLCCLDSQRFEQAVACFQTALQMKPDSPPTIHNLGTALYLLGRSAEAARAFDRCLLLRPNASDSLLSLGQVMIDLTEPAQAEKCARRALALDPRSVEGHLLLASALDEQGVQGESEGHLQTAVSLDPESGKAHGLLALRYQASGRFEDANRHLQRSIELEPDQGFYYFAYAYNNKMGEADRPKIDRMEELAQEDRLPPREKAFLRYGLARSYERLGDYERALRNFDEANRLSRRIKFGDESFDRGRHSADIDRHIGSFDAETIGRLRSQGNPSDEPIVIVGMMRSGTTLAEQILSSHPEIGPAGEQRFWLAIRERIFKTGPSILPELATEYLKVLRKVAPGSIRITDKNPGNYEMVGAIHCALPNARFIHMRRNPVDTCLSIYVTPNRVRVPFAYDRENIVFAYREYQRLMEHWRTVIPSNRFLEVEYETLVADREGQTRRMLDFIGLEWNDAVLHHENNNRTVLTPSNWQVRQPIYTGSVDRWRKYEPWLGVFSELIPGQAG
jgi:tetratricopeptide (TPR) repeat protein